MKGQRRVPLVSKGRIEQIAASPIAGFVGWNGSGKSLAATAAAMVHLERGRPVLSTVRLLDYLDPRDCDDDSCTWLGHGEPGHRAAHPLWQPLEDFEQLYTARDTHVLLDEVNGVADAREHQSMPPAVARFLPQLRRRNVTLHWTTIGWSFADVRIRRITYCVVHATGLMGVKQPDHLWRANRLFMWRVYAAKDFDAFESRKGEGVKAVGRHVFWRPGSDVERAYDSMDVVTDLGSVTDGKCEICGLKARVQYCAGHGARPDVPQRRSREERPLGPAPVNEPTTAQLAEHYAHESGTAL